MHKKQVDKSHYSFSNYVHKGRWISFWHQIDEVLALNPSTVLEIGPGPGIFKALANHFGLHVETVDIDPDLNPDHVASARELPFDDNSYDCVCAFQMLEHLPYEHSLESFAEMVRVTKKNIIISLPDAKMLWTYSIHIPKIGQVIFHLPRPSILAQPNMFDTQHRWEINKEGFSLKKIIADFTPKEIKRINTYRVDEYPYHRFFIFEKRHL